MARLLDFQNPGDQRKDAGFSELHHPGAFCREWSNSMDHMTHHSIDVRANALIEPAFPPLEAVTRPNMDTAAAAYYMNRRPQTLRIWACKENGPIRPIRVNGRLAWKTADLRKLLGVA
jgi:hypothetical protein